MLNRILLDPGVKNDRQRHSTHHSYIPSESLIGRVGLSYYSHGPLDDTTGTPLPTSSRRPTNPRLPADSPRPTSAPQLTKSAKPRLSPPVSSFSNSVPVGMTKENPTNQVNVIDLTADSPKTQNVALPVEDNAIMMAAEGSQRVGKVADTANKKPSVACASVTNESRGAPQESTRGGSKLLEAPGEACNMKYVSYQTSPWLDFLIWR